jgi:hypothetical protein
LLAAFKCAWTGLVLLFAAKVLAFRATTRRTCPL